MSSFPHHTSAPFTLFRPALVAAHRAAAHVSLITSAFLSTPAPHSSIGTVPDTALSHSHSMAPRLTTPCLALLADKADGTFLVRAREGDASGHVLSVVFRGKATHHLLAAGEGKTLAINRRELLADACTLEAVRATEAARGREEKI